MDVVVNMMHELDAETYVKVEKAARAAKKTVEEWIEFILLERVGNTSFYREG